MNTARALTEWFAVLAYVLYAAVTGASRFEVRWLLNRYRERRPPWPWN